MAKFTIYNIKGNLIFEGDSLKGQHFIEGVFRRFDLENMDLRDTIFEKCYMEGINFKGSDLSGSKFEGSRFRENGRYSSFEMTNCNKCDFTGVILTDVNLENASFREAIFDRCTFGETNCKGSDFSRASFRNATCLFHINCNYFDNLTKVDGANFSDAIFDWALLPYELSMNPCFNKANLTKVIFPQEDEEGYYYYDVRDKETLSNHEITHILVDLVDKITEISETVSRLEESLIDKYLG